jgi:hypothetical protein
VNERIDRLERRITRLRHIAEVAETPLSARILKLVERMSELARQVEQEHQASVQPRKSVKRDYKKR